MRHPSPRHSGNLDLDLGHSIIVPHENINGTPYSSERANRAADAQMRHPSPRHSGNLDLDFGHSIIVPHENINGTPYSSVT
ncbi:hypothetical protein V498_06518 [Pseudogymnoascus sp. VKM F-4517 (FW-2822)]|nr:hypothetical protein V498_06518 [Pseudogymnoascus sp. VKM F-4517 (FW-2822)]